MGQSDTIVHLLCNPYGETRDPQCFVVLTVLDQRIDQAFQSTQQLGVLQFILLKQQLVLFCFGLDPHECDRQIFHFRRRW